MIISQYSSALEINEAKGKKVIYNLLNHSIGMIRAASYAEAEQGYALQLPKDDLSVLIDMDVLVEDKKDDREKALYYTRKSPFSNPVGYLTILTCLDCNLKCEYCSQKHFMNGQKMDATRSESIAAWATNWIKSNHLQHITVSIIGGEPLLNMSPLNIILPALRRTGAQITVNVVTNGVLLDTEMVKKLVNLNIEKVQVTLDGDATTHDQIKHIRREGTFQTILEGVERCTEAGLEVDIRINYPKRKKEQATNALRALRDLKNKFRIQVYFSEVQTEPFFCSNEMANIIPDFYEMAYGMGFSIPGPFGSLLCQAESDHGFTIDPTGVVYKCYNSVGMPHQQLGEIVDGRLMVKNHAVLNNHPILDCLSCKYFPVCRGGCKHMRQARNLAPNTRMCGYDNYQLAEQRILPLYIGSLLRKAVK